MIDAYVTNLKKQNEGEYFGKYLKLPALKEDVKALLTDIGVDGVIYQDTYIAFYAAETEGLEKHLTEYENIDELNYLAALLKTMDARETYKFEAMLEYGDHTSNLNDIINLAKNQKCYDLNEDITNHEELGAYHASQNDYIKIPETLEYYIDYDSYGRDIAKNDGGMITQYGYITKTREPFTEHYKGKADIPREYRIFEYPDPPNKMPIMDQLQMYRQMALSSAVYEKQAPTREER